MALFDNLIIVAVLQHSLNSNKRLSLYEFVPKGPHTERFFSLAFILFIISSLSKGWHLAHDIKECANIYFVIQTKNIVQTYNWKYILCNCMFTRVFHFITAHSRAVNHHIVVNSDANQSMIDLVRMRFIVILTDSRDGWCAIRTTTSRALRVGRWSAPNPTRSHHTKKNDI